MNINKGLNSQWFNNQEEKVLVLSVRDGEPHFHTYVLMSAHISITMDLNKVCYSFEWKSNAGCFLGEGDECDGSDSMNMDKAALYYLCKSFCKTRECSTAKALARSCCHKHTFF